MKFLTTLPFAAAFVVALVTSLSPTGVEVINRRALGALDVGLWRRRVGDVAAAAVSWFAGLWRPSFGFALGVAALALLIADLSAAHAAGLGLATVAASTEPSLTDVKSAIESGNRLFEEFKRTNDERLKQIEARGVADPLLEQKLAKLTEAIDKQSQVNEQFIQTRQIVDRMAAAGFQKSAEGEIGEKALKRFNTELRQLAIEKGRAFTEVDAAGVKAYSESFEKLLRKGDRDLTDVERRALSVGNDGNGGYWVSPDLTGKAVERIYETSPIRLYAAQQTISTDALEGTVDLEEASFGWVSELGTRSESNTPAIPKPWRIPVHEAYAEPRLSQKLVEDSAVDPVAWLSRKLGDKFGRGYNAAFVAGNGVGKPRGFASYTSAATADGSRDWGVFEHVATGTNGTFGTDPNGINKLLDLIHAMKDHFLAGAAFYMNRTTLGQLRKVTDASSAGKYVFIPSMQAGLPDQLMGYPVRKLQDMATYSTTDALAVAFGNMEETYQIVDRLGLTVLVDPYTAKPWVKYYTRGRVGGDVLNFEAMKFLKFGTS
jgi:HK97 family phage major capsid protein